MLSDSLPNCSRYLFRRMPKVSELKYGRENKLDAKYFDIRPALTDH